MPTGSQGSDHDRRQFLVIDQGGHASRAVLFSATGELQAQAEVAVAVSRQGDHVEQAAHELGNSIDQAMAGVLAGHDASIPLSVGLCTQRSSLVCWTRESGKPLSAVISWQDRRAAEVLDRHADQFAFIQAQTGLMPNPHYGASKMRWCLEHIPALQRPAGRGQLVIGPLAAFIVAHLVPGQPPRVDPVNAARTLLCNLDSGDWDARLLALFQLSRDQLPEIVPTRFDYGDCRSASHRLPLRVVCGDQPAALFAQGMPDPDIAYINLGTGAFVQRVSNAPVRAQRLLTGIAADLGERRVYTLEATVNGAGSALEALCPTLGMALDSVLQQAPVWLQACRSPPLFLNGVSGLGSPYWQALESRFVGTGDVPAQVVAILESMVFLLQVNLDHMRRYLTPPREIRITGGLARLDGMCRRLADLAGVPVVRPQLHEASARGTAFLLAGCPSEWSALDVQRFLPQANVDLHARYHQWRQQLERALDNAVGASS